MPRRAKRPCNAPGCPALIDVGRYCEEHRPMAVRPDRRESAARRGYDRRWQKIRLNVLNKHPLCADPFGVHAEHNETVLATDVDHIQPYREVKTHDESNLQPLCASCHSRKTAMGQ